MDGAAQRDDVGVAAVAVDAHDVVSGQRFFPNANRRCVVLLVVRGQDDGVVDEHRVAVGQVIPVLVGVASALFRGAWNANDVEGGAPLRGEVAQHVLQVRLDLRAVGHALGVLRHQQRRLVQQLHVHVDVVNAVVGQVVHLHVGVHPMKRLDDLVDVVFGVVWKRGPPRLVAVVLVEDEFGGEGGAVAVRHPVAARVHQVARRFNGAVQGQAHVVGQRIRDGVVVGTRAVVQPVDQHAPVVPLGVHRVGAVIPNPNAVGGHVHHFDAVHGQRSTAGSSCEVGCGLVGLL